MDNTKTIQEILNELDEAKKAEQKSLTWGTPQKDTGQYEFYPDPFQDTGTALKEAHKKAQQQAVHFQQQMVEMTTAERLDKIEDSLKTILNMLKLILGTQIEKEMKDRKEKKSQEELS